MGFEQFKFNKDMFKGYDISSLSDTPSADGMSASELKARFDNIPKMMIALGKFNELLDYLIAGGYITKGDVESVLKGEILTHEHPEKTTKQGIENVLTGNIFTHGHNAKNVVFDDGENFQRKYENNELKGPRGTVGETGPQGPQGKTGPQGPPGVAGAPGIVVTAEINGAYQFSVENGNLFVSYAGENPPAFSIENGILYLDV